MDKINDCFERIQVIRGVNNGRITNEQIRDVATLYQLDADEKEELLKLLEGKKIYPVSEAEIPRVPASSAFVTSKSVKKLTKKIELTKEEKKEILDNMFRKLCEELKENPELLNQYLEEFQILKEAIVENNENYEKPAHKIIEFAVMDISRYRVRNRRNNGWVCGTYMSRIRKIFQRWLKFYFSEEELEELIQCCKEDKVDVEGLIKLFLFLKETPRTLIHPFFNRISNSSGID